MRHQVSGTSDSFSLPDCCVCCGGAVETELKIEVIASGTWRFPHCQACQRHVQAWKASNIGCLAVGMFVVWPTVGLIFGAGLDPTLGVILVGIVIIILGIRVNLKRKRAHDLRTPACASDDGSAAVILVRGGGTAAIFDIKSEAFALDFMRDNASNLIDVPPDLQRRLELPRDGS